MISYRPTDTCMYMDCPKKWELYRLKNIRYNHVTRKDIAAAFGTAFHQAMDDYWRSDYPNHQMIDRAIDRFNNELSLVYGDENLANYYKDEEPYNATSLVRSINAVIDNGPDVFNGYNYEESEYEFKFKGTADLILRDINTNELVIADYKTKVCYNKQQRDQYIHEFASRWQMKHYCAAAQIEFNQPCYRYMLIMVIPNMKRDILHTQLYELSPNYAEKFLLNAEQVWLDMDSVTKGRIDAYENYDHWNRYGRCDYYDLCVTHNGNIDDAIMGGDYIQLGEN
jgi:hypothetical protein